MTKKNNNRTLRVTVMIIVIFLYSNNTSEGFFPFGICSSADSWDMSAVPGLIDSLKNDDSKNRLCALEGLRRFGNHTAIPALIRALSDRNESIKYKASLALDRMIQHYSDPISKEIEERKKIIKNLRSLDKSLIDSVIVAALDDNGDIRITALNLLTIIKTPRAAPAIFYNSFSKEYYISTTAREAFFALGKDAGSFFANILESSSSKDKIQYACWYLYYCRDKAPVPALMKLVKKSKNIVKEYYLLDALASCGAAKAIPIFKGLLGSYKIEVRKTAMRSLTKVSSGYGEQLVPVISRIMLYDSDRDIDQNIRWDAADTLGNMGYKSALPYLHKALNHSDKFVRSSAADALSKIPDEKSIQPLLRAYCRENFSHASFQMINALYKIPGSAEKIINWLKSKNYKAQDCAIKILNAQIKFPDKDKSPFIFVEPVTDATPYLIKIAMRRRNKWYPIKALCKCGDDRAFEPLLKLWKTKNKNIRDCLTESFGDLRDKRAVPLLTDVLLNHKNQFFRRNAAKSLGKIGSPDALPALHTSLYKETYNHGQTEIAEAIMKIGHRQSIPIMLKAMSDSRLDSSAQKAAVRALIKISDKSTVPDLLSKLNLDNFSYTEEVAYALGKIGDKRAIKPLKKIIKECRKRNQRADDYERALRMIVQ